MNQTKYQMMEEWLASKIASCKTEIAALNADQRTDEAIFSKIQMNVYDIFKTVLTAGAKATNGIEEEHGVFFQKKLEQIPENWRTSLLDAQLHENTEKAHIERIKLNTAEEIAAEFRKIWEVAE